MPTLEQLNADPMNPRIITKEEYNELKKLLDTFGDLSGIIRNVRTDQLVGGHMRVRRFQEAGHKAQIQITQRFDPVTRTGTTAVGYVTMDGEMFAYREVDWSEGTQRAANVAANKAGGSFDRQALAEVMYEISKLENGADLLALTAHTDDEVEKLLKSVAPSDEPPAEENQDEDDGKLTFKLTADQKQLIQKAIHHIKVTREIPTGDDEARNGSALYYMAQHYIDTNPPLTPEQLGQEFVPPELPE